MVLKFTVGRELICKGLLIIINYVSCIIVLKSLVNGIYRFYHEVEVSVETEASDITDLYHGTSQILATLETHSNVPFTSLFPWKH